MSIFASDLLVGKTAFVTGGGTGICRGIALGLAQHGAEIAILSRKLDVLEQTAREIESATGRRCLAVSADVRAPEQVGAAVARAMEVFGHIDLLVNGAAGNFLSPAAALSPNGFGTVLDIDTKGTWNVTRAVFDAWMRDHGGRILNLSALLDGAPLQVHAAAAKAAIDSMTRTLAVEWGSLGIRVNAIAPGAIGDTEGARRLVMGEFADKLVQSTPIRRIGRIDDVVNLALFLCSEAADNINGAIIPTDGGHHLVGAFPAFG